MTRENVSGGREEYSEAIHVKRVRREGWQLCSLGRFGTEGESLKKKKTREGGKIYGRKRSPNLLGWHGAPGLVPFLESAEKKGEKGGRVTLPSLHVAFGGKGKDLAPEERQPSFPRRNSTNIKKKNNFLLQKEPIPKGLPSSLLERSRGRKSPGKKEKLLLNLSSACRIQPGVWGEFRKLSRGKEGKKAYRYTA